jgi:hypothetical protein
MVVNLYTTKCSHPAQITAGVLKQDSPVQVTQCYTAFPPGSRVISLPIPPQARASRPRGRPGVVSPGGHFTGMNLSPERWVFTPGEGLPPWPGPPCSSRAPRSSSRCPGPLDLPYPFQEGDLRDGLAVVELHLAGKHHQVFPEIDLRYRFPRLEGLPYLHELIRHKIRLCLIGYAVSPILPSMDAKRPEHNKEGGQSP